MTHCALYKKIRSSIDTLTNSKMLKLGCADIKMVLNKKETDVIEIYSPEHKTEVVVSLDNKHEVARICHAVKAGEMQKFQDIFGIPLTETLTDAQEIYLDVVDWITNTDSRCIKHTINL